MKSEEFYHVTVLAPIAQFRNYYQFGKVKDCDEEWNEFVFCLSLKLKKPQEAKQMFDEREEKLRVLGKRIEPFWQLRKEPPEDFPPRTNVDGQK